VKCEIHSIENLPQWSVSEPNPEGRFSPADKLQVGDESQFVPSRQMNTDSAAESAVLHNQTKNAPFRRLDFERRFGLHEAQRDLKGKTIRSGAITVIGQISRFFLYSCSGIVLARLLTPQDYGLVGMVTAVTGLLRLFKDGGLSTATIQRSSISHELVSTVFWTGIGLASAMTLLACVLAPGLVIFYREPRLYWITFAMAMTFILDAMGAQHFALMRRQMRFKATAVIDLVSMSTACAAGIISALKGLGYWSLIILQITLPVVSLLCVWIAEPWRPEWPRLHSGARSMLRFGGYFTGVNVLNYVFRNIDNVLVGWRWGAGPLGFYQKAYSLLLLPIDQVNAPITAVAVSSLSRLHSDPARYRRFFIRGYTVASSITIPIVAAAAVSAVDVVPLLLGKQWIPCVRIFQLLAPAALVGALLGPLHWLFVSSGRTDRQLGLGVPWTILTILGFLVGLPYGPQGVAVCYSGLSLLLAAPIFLYALKGTPISLVDVLGALRYPALSVGVACAAGLLLRTELLSSAPIAVRAIADCGTVLVLYAFILLVVLRQWNSYRDLFSHLLPSRRN
jgi:PST family polysaccharide transporter